MDAGACTTKCVELLSAADAAPAPAPAGPGSAGWAARCRRAGVLEDCTEEKLLFAEHGAAQPTNRSRSTAVTRRAPCAPSPHAATGTKLPEGHVATVTVDDLPDEEEDDGDGLGDFVNDIGGGDDY